VIRGSQYQSTGKKVVIEVSGFLGLGVLLICLAQGIYQLRNVIGVDGDLLIEVVLWVGDVGALIETNHSEPLLRFVFNCDFRSVRYGYKTGHVISKKHAIV
jgi:hypothetical protein